MSQPEPEEELVGGLLVGWASGEAEEIVKPAPQARRYFSATAMSGRLYVQGVPGRGPWDPGLLVYWTEPQVDSVFNENVGDRKVRSADELRRALQASAVRGLPAMKLWIAEGLEDPARVEWQRSGGQGNRETG